MTNAENEAWEPEFFTAQELRRLADHMDWLAEGPIKEAVVRVGGPERPEAWVWVSAHNGPTVQVVFAPHEDLGGTLPIPPTATKQAER
jgi:hypothetical protein